jgi:hypothetical protein
MAVERAGEKDVAGTSRDTKGATPRPAILVEEDVNHEDALLHGTSKHVG